MENPAIDMKDSANAPLNLSQHILPLKQLQHAFLQWAIENKVSMSLLRVFQIYGEGELSSRLYPSLIKAAKAGQDFL